MILKWSCWPLFMTNLINNITDKLPKQNTHFSLGCQAFDCLLLPAVFAVSPDLRISTSLVNHWRHVVFLLKYNRNYFISKIKFTAINCENVYVYHYQLRTWCSCCFQGFDFPLGFLKFSRHQLIFLAFDLELIINLAHRLWFGCTQQFMVQYRCGARSHCWIWVHHQLLNH